MKLLYCYSCQDVVKLHVLALAGYAGQPTRCKCQQSWGYYKHDELNAVYGGPSILLGINNFDLHSALTLQGKHGNLPSGYGRKVEAFIIPTNASTIHKEDGATDMAKRAPRGVNTKRKKDDSLGTS